MAIVPTAIFVCIFVHISSFAMAHSIGGEVRSTRSMSVRATGHVMNQDVLSTAATAAMVRKVSKSATLDLSREQRVSTFAGMQRTDRYTKHPGIVCSSIDGGSDIGTAPKGVSLVECKASCAQDDQCACVNFDAKNGRCGKQRFCYPEDCPQSLLNDVYIQHSSFTLPGPAPLASFERSGGRDCVVGQPASANTTDIDNETAAERGLSVTQCLSKCLNLTACTCVRYERYYVSECFMKKHCPLSADCQRSNKTDMYVELTQPALLQPTLMQPTETDPPTPFSDPTPGPTLGRQPRPADGLEWSENQG